MRTKPSLGIIGYGGFGSYLADKLGLLFTIRTYDTRWPDAGPPPHATSLEAVCNCDLIVPAVPISALAQTCEAITRHVDDIMRPLIVDVCSVKLEPEAILKRSLPDGARYVLTHPLFGPKSAPTTVRGRTIALCGGSISDADQQRVQAFFERRLGLRVVHVSPDEHDRAMARVQGLTHFIAQAFKAMTLDDTPLATDAYRQLLSLQDVLSLDSWALFETIVAHNPYATGEIDRLMSSISDLRGRLPGKGESRH
ncbi:MAG: prephenate dehydrogenase/arogenate dehydrogenase family protein [Planctomycetota bacterium]